MSKPVDLTGIRFGRLVVVERMADLVSASGKSRNPAWRCVCDCGRSEVFAAYRLSSTPGNLRRGDPVEQCTVCTSQRACQVCGAGFMSRKVRATCSPECAASRKRDIDLDRYHQHVERNPDHNRDILAARRARAAADPAYAQHRAAQQAEQYKRSRAAIMADPDRRAHYAELERKRYAKDPDRKAKNKAARDKRIAAMTPEQYELWAERARASWQRSAQKKRSTPEGQQRYREYMREYLRQQALRGLAGLSDTLIRRSVTDE